MFEPELVLLFFFFENEKLCGANGILAGCRLRISSNDQLAAITESKLLKNTVIAIPR